MKNYLIKFWFYLNNGNIVTGNFKSLFLGIIALYFTLKLTSPLLMVIMFLVSIPILTIIGYYNIHHVAKISDQLATKYGTHYGIKQFEFIEKQTQLLQELVDLLKYSNNVTPTTYTQPIIKITATSTAGKPNKHAKKK